VLHPGALEKVDSDLRLFGRTRDGGRRASSSPCGGGYGESLGNGATDASRVEDRRHETPVVAAIFAHREIHRRVKVQQKRYRPRNVLQFGEEEMDGSSYALLPDCSSGGAVEEQWRSSGAVRQYAWWSPAVPCLP
jgi:hypothetical protein